MTGSGNLLNELLGIVKRQTGLNPLPFNPACSDKAIHDAEQSLGVRLPEDYKAFLTTHNGETDPFTLVFPPDQITFLPIHDVTELWQQLQAYRDDLGYEEFDSEKKVRNVLYHPGRIPIANNESGVAYLCLDYIPGPKGKEGQLVFNINEADMVSLAESFSALLQDYLALLTTGRAVVRKQPERHGEGHWFESDKGEYIDWKVYRRLMDG